MSDRIRISSGGGWGRGSYISAAGRMAQVESSRAALMLISTGYEAGESVVAAVGINSIRAAPWTVKTLWKLHRPRGAPRTFVLDCGTSAWPSSTSA